MARNRRGIILQGDKALAGRYLPFATAQLEALFRGAPSRMTRTFRPASGVTVRVEREGDHGRVWIEAGGADFVASDYAPPGTDGKLYLGRLRGGIAKPRGTSVFAQTAEHSLYPLGDGAFIAGPGSDHQRADAAQLIATRGKVEGAAFSPWQDGAYDILGISGVCYSGLRDGGDGLLYKRMHVAYEYNRVFDYVHIINGPSQGNAVMPAVSTSLDSGASFTTTIFNIPIQAFSGADVVDQAHIRFEGITFCGLNRVAIVCTTFPAVKGGSGDVLLFNILGLTSADGGATWSANVTQIDAADSSRLSVVYLGGSSILALSNHLSADVGQPLTVWRSDDYGATFAKIATPAGVPSIQFTDLVCLAQGAAGFQRGLNFWRTADSGASWSALPLPADFNNTQPGRIAIPRTPVVPDPLPGGKSAMDYTPLVMLKNIPPGGKVQVVTSDDGGATWRDGGQIPVVVPNVGITDPKLPPYPVFPDLHKNGLEV